VKDAADYLSYLKALIALNHQIVHWRVLREEAQGDLGLLRYRLTFRDNSLLEMFELFQVVGGRLQVTKYSFHWQDASGQLRHRWDNAAHHPELSTSPDHVHEGVEGDVLAHKPMSVEEILALVTEKLAG
jgi:hypothetical protein